MNKQVIKGWVSRDVAAKDFVVRSLYAITLNPHIDIEKAKGKRIAWFSSDWPPKKVTITIEIGE